MANELRKVVNENGHQVFAIMGEYLIFRVFEDKDGDRFVKVGDKYESLKWYARQRYNISLMCDRKLELAYDRHGW